MAFSTLLTPEDVVVIEELDQLTDQVRREASQMGAQEVRFLVDTYYQIQEQRKATANQTRALGEADEPIALLSHFEKLNAYTEKRTKQMLQAYAEAKADASWAMSIRGVGPVIAAGLAAHIDITLAPTAGHIWRFAGLDPTVEWNKKQKRPWNAKLKTLCWKVGESFVKVSNRDDDIYGHIYASRKRLEEERNEAGLFADQAEAKLEKYKISQTTEAYTAYSKGKLPPAHIHSRAKRYAVKRFLSHNHHVAYEVEFGKAPPKPYILTQPNHTHYMGPPNWPM